MSPAGEMVAQVLLWWACFSAGRTVGHWSAVFYCRRRYLLASLVLVAGVLGIAALACVGADLIHRTGSP